MALEKHIEDLIESHPYLLAPELEGLKPQRQLKKGKGRLDLVFRIRRSHCIVELKKTELKVEDVRQIIRYCRKLQREKLRLCEHYLVGKRPSEPAKLSQLIERSGFRISLRFLGEHVPLRLIWHTHHRRYVAYSEDIAGSVLEIRV